MSLLAIVVALCTAYGLSRPAITREIICTIPEHTHTDDCYTQLEAPAETIPVCTPETLGLHEHTAACYGADGELVCGYADFVIHHHDAACYDEDGSLWCPLPEVWPHEHTEACYTWKAADRPGIEEDKPMASGGVFTPDVEGSQVLSIEPEDGFATREAVFADMSDTSDMEFEVISEEELEPVLTCGMEEIVPHTHTAACFDADGNWICGKLEMFEHQHSDACFETTESSADALTCTNTDPNHVHGPRCYGTWVLTCGMEEHTHTDACFSEVENPPVDEEDPSDEDGPIDGDDTTPDASPEDSPNATAGTLNISLLYGDELPQEGHPEGVYYYTHSTMSGYLRLEPSNLDADLTDVTVTLSLPKQYVEKDSFSIPPFSTNSSATQYEILPVEEDSDSYYIRILFTTYDKTQTLVLPFSLSFLDDVVPDNYWLPVTAWTSLDSTPTAPNIYRPEYRPWQIDKYVNSNQLDAFRQDGAEVVVTPAEEDGNPYLDDLTYVDFAFVVNQYANVNSQLADLRDVCEITLTDTLPEYTDRSGNRCIAAFDADRNPGWTLSDDGTTVSKTYTGTNSSDVLLQVCADELHLRFPGLPFEILEDGTLRAELTNTVSFIATPSNAAEGETYPEGEDSLLFRMTDDPSAQGRFSKAATKGDIYDVDVYKTNPYPWSIALSNERVQPLRHIIIQDRKIAENGEIAVAGLDEALKFVRLESSTAYSALSSGQTYADIVDKVVAYYTDGTTEEFPVTQLDDRGNFTVTFNEDKVCEGYDIVFADDYAMRYNEKVNFMAYTVYRDPEGTHVPEGVSQVNYSNTARSVNSYQIGDQTEYVYLLATHSYNMLPSTEKLAISKLTLCNDETTTLPRELPNGKTENCGGTRVGDYYMYQLTLTGSLLEPNEKTYEDLRIVDLLPDGVRYDSIYLLQGDSTHPFLDGGRKYQPEIIENYHNSGRTAVIFHLNAENLQYNLANGKYATLYFWVQIEKDARPGTIRNYAYVVGDNLDEYLDPTGGTDDSYDLNNNGQTDDRIAWSFSDATIVAAQSTYAEKFIAPAGSENWSKQGLSMKAGESFDYLLKITNETSTEHTGLTIYDTLPQLDDWNIFGTQARDSEFHVQLRDAITPPVGYTVYYTTSPEVYSQPMSALIDAGIWSATVQDYASVTAFKLVAVEGTILAGHSTFEVRIPVAVPTAFSEASLAILKDKAYQDQASGTMAYLEAINSFGFRTAQSPSEKESNTVWARVPFAGFCVKKVDYASGEALPGAEFTLTDASGNVISTAVSNDDGFLCFRDLTEGVYTLSETVVPEGYLDKHVAITVTITQNPVTMEYTVQFGGAYTGSGSAADPLRVQNTVAYRLPETGGSGVVGYYVLGTALMLLAWMLQRRKRRWAEN